MDAATLEMTDIPNRSSEEKEIVARAQAGDTSAFEVLYHANAGRIYAVCLRMTGNRATAEDLTQEAFVRAWRKIGSFRGASAFSTWLHRLTVNVVLTELRSQGRRNDRIMLTDDIGKFNYAQKTPRPHVNIDLKKAIANLPEGARKVFVLHDVEGYRHAEIAGMLGIATGTTKAQLHRARRLLREALA